MKKINIWIACGLALVLFAIVPIVFTVGKVQASGTAIEIKGLTNSTLTALRGNAQTKDKETDPDPDRNPVTVTEEGYYRLSFHSWHCRVGDKAVEFITPVTSEALLQSGGLTIRMFVHVSASSPFFIGGEGNGIFFYGLGNGITGAKSDGYIELPADIKQDTWIDFNVSAPSSMALLDTGGNLNGIQYGAYIKSSNDKQFYLGAPAANKSYIYIESISLRDNTEQNDYSEDMYVATGAYGENPVSEHEKWGGVLNGFNGTYSTESGWEDIQKRSIRMVEDDTSANGRVYAMNFHSWYQTVSTNVLAFNRIVDISEVSGGMIIRINAHLSPRSPYRTDYGGLRLLPFDATGNKDEGYMIPGDIIQDTWITLRLSAYEAASLANENGKIYGFQIGAAFRGGNELSSIYVGESVMNIKIDYIAVCEEQTLTYHNLDANGGEKSVPVMSGLGIESSYYYPPKKSGWLFMGWYEGINTTDFSGGLFDFSAQVTDDIHITARWNELCADISDYYGVYTKGEERFTISDYGIDVSDVTDRHYEDYGVSNGGVLYLVSADNVKEIDLNASGEYTKQAYNTLTYYAFGECVGTQIFGVNEQPYALAYEPSPGYNFVLWCADKQTNEGSAAYIYPAALSGDITLYAYCMRQTLPASSYQSYLGTYYNVSTRAILTLGTFNSASVLYSDGSKLTAQYYLLENGGVAFIAGGKETPGVLAGTRLIIGADEFVHLTAYTVKFESEGKTFIVSTVDGGGYVVAKPDEPVRENLKFVGWYTSMQGKEEFDFNSTIFHNMTLYARWEKASDNGSEGIDAGNGKNGACASSSAGSTFLLLPACVALFLLMRRK